MKPKNPKSNLDKKQIHKLEVEDPWKTEGLRAIKAAKSPKFSEQMWALLMAKAIGSFNQGLEDRIDFEACRRASNLRAKIIRLVGEEAHNIIAFVVNAQRRPIDIYAQASSIYTKAMANLRDQKALFAASKQLYDISKTQGLDQDTAAQIAGLAADLQEKSSAATAYAGGAGSSGLSQAGMPTGVTIQGRYHPKIADKWDEEFFANR